MSFTTISGMRSTRTWARTRIPSAELVERVMRFGHHPHVADTFCGFGQIPFDHAAGVRRLRIRPEPGGLV